MKKTAIEVSSYKKTVRQIITKNLNVRKVCAKIMLKNLNKEKVEKKGRLLIFWKNSKEDPDLLSSVVTCDD
jgi:RNA-binding protein YhbY